MKYIKKPPKSKTDYTYRNFIQINQLINQPSDKHKKCLNYTNFYKLDKAIEQKQPIIYAQMDIKPCTDHDITYRYGVLSVYNQLIDVIINTQVNYRTYNELIKQGQPCKLAFDLEWCDYIVTDKDKPDQLGVIAKQFTVEQTLAEFKKTLFTTAKQVFGLDINDNNLLILNSSRPVSSDKTHRNYFKNSFHVYVINYGYLPNLEHYHRIFANLLVEATNTNPILNNRLCLTCSGNEKLSHVIDTSIYSKNHCFRCVWCTKPKKNSFLLPAEKDYQLPIHQFFMGWLTPNDKPLNISKLPTQIHTTLKVVPNRQTQVQFQIDPPKHLEQYITKLLNLISIDRIDSYQSWFDIAYRIHSIHPSLFNIFDNWSKRGKGYNQHNNSKIWNGLHGHSYQSDQLERILEIVGIDHCNFPPDFDPLKQQLKKSHITLEQLGFTYSQLIGCDNDSINQIADIVNKIKLPAISQAHDAIQHLIKQKRVAIGRNLPEIQHQQNGYNWNYMYQECPRDPLFQSKINKYWGATIHTNTTSSFVDIDPIQLISQLNSGKYTTVVIKSPCGSAKSDFMTKLITLMYTMGLLPNNFLLLSALRTLSSSLQSRFMGNKKPYGWGPTDPNPNDTNLISYRDLKETNDLIDANINIVINSLPKLADFGRDSQLDNYQRTMIVIDEFKSFLLNLCGATLKGNRRQVIEQLEHYLRNAPFVLVMDQNIDDDCLKSLFDVRDPLHTVIFDYQMQTCQDQTVYELTDFDMTMDLMDREYLSKNKLVYICCNTKTKGADRIASYISHKYPTYHIKTYTSDTPESEKQQIGQCEQLWTDYVVVSPSVIYGVDFSKKDVFSATFCFIDQAHTIPASLIVQQMRRVRYLIDDKIYICNQSTSKWTSNQFDQIDSQILHRIRRNHLEIPVETPIEVQPEVQVPIKSPTQPEVTQIDSDAELECMLLKSRLDAHGCPQMKHTWFSDIYRQYYRTDIESRDNIIGWIRGYLCAVGFKYYVIGPNQHLEGELKDTIKQNLMISEELRLQTQMTTYLETPIAQNSTNKLSETKYYHCRMFGLNAIDADFYQQWIDNQQYRTMANLVTYLLPERIKCLKQQAHNRADYQETEEPIATYRLFKELLDVCKFDLDTYLFTGLPPTELRNYKLSDSQLKFLNDNQRDFKKLFGLAGRMRGEPTTYYHIMKFLSRIIKPYLGVKLKCEKKRVVINNKDIRISSYSLKVPDEIYELITYRLLADKHRSMKWIFDRGICDNLHDKFNTINHQWSHLAIVKNWSESMDLLPEPDNPIKSEHSQVLPNSHENCIQTEDDDPPLLKGCRL